MAHGDQERIALPCTALCARPSLFPRGPFHCSGAAQKAAFSLCLSLCLSLSLSVSLSLSDRPWPIGSLVLLEGAHNHDGVVMDRARGVELPPPLLSPRPPSREMLSCVSANGGLAGGEWSRCRWGKGCDEDATPGPAPPAPAAPPPAASAAVRPVTFEL